MPSRESLVSRLGYGHVFRFDDEQDGGCHITSSRSATMINNLKNKLALLERKQEATRSELKLAAEARDRHRNTLSATQAEKNQLRQQLSRLVKEIDQKQHMIGSLKQSVTDTEARVEQVKQLAKESSKKTDEFRASLRSREQAVARMNEQTLLAQTQTQTLRASLDHLTTNLHHTLQLYNDLKTTIETATRHCLDRQAELIELGHAVQQAQTRKNQLVEETQDNLTAAQSITVNSLAAQVTMHLEREAELAAKVAQCEEQMNSLLYRIRHF